MGLGPKGQAPLIHFLQPRAVFLVGVFFLVLLVFPLARGIYPSF
jgi:hypothetical protein